MKPRKEALLWAPCGRVGFWGRRGFLFGGITSMLERCEPEPEPGPEPEPPMGLIHPYCPKEPEIATLEKWPASTVTDERHLSIYEYHTLEGNTDYGEPFVASMPGFQSCFSIVFVEFCSNFSFSLFYFITHVVVCIVIKKTLHLLLIFKLKNEIFTASIMDIFHSLLAVTLVPIQFLPSFFLLRILYFFFV